MTTSTFTPNDIVNFAAAKDAVNVSNAFDQLVGQKVLDAIEARKQHVASAMFNNYQEDEKEENSVDNTTAADSEEQVEQETEESNEDAQIHS